MTRRAGNAPSHPFRRRVLLTLGALSVTFLASAANAGDVQRLLPGQASTDKAICVDDAGDGLTTTPVPDDELDGTTRIIAGPDRICETTAAAGDHQAIAVGNGQPYQAVVRTGNQGICDDAIVPGGDDRVLIPQGRGRALMVAIRPGTDNIIQ